MRNVTGIALKPPYFRNNSPTPERMSSVRPMSPTRVMANGNLPSTGRSAGAALSISPGHHHAGEGNREPHREAEKMQNEKDLVESVHGQFFLYVAFVVIGLPLKFDVDSTTRAPDASSVHDCVVSAGVPLKLIVVVMTSFAPSHLTFEARSIV